MPPARRVDCGKVTTDETLNGFRGRCSGANPVSPRQLRRLMAYEPYLLGIEAPMSALGNLSPRSSVSQNCPPDVRNQ